MLKIDSGNMQFSNKIRVSIFSNIYNHKIYNNVSQNNQNRMRNAK